MGLIEHTSKDEKVIIEVTFWKKLWNFFFKKREK